MPTISPVPNFTAQKVNFTANKGMQYDNDFNSAMNRMEKWDKGGSTKKTLGAIAVLAILAGVVLHKVPPAQMEKLPGFLKPVAQKGKDAAGAVVNFFKGLVGKVKNGKGAEQAAEQVQKFLPPA